MFEHAVTADTRLAIRANTTITTIIIIPTHPSNKMVTISTSSLPLANMHARFHHLGGRSVHAQAAHTLTMVEGLVSSHGDEEMMESSDSARGGLPKHFRPMISDILFHFLF